MAAEQLLIIVVSTLITMLVGTISGQSLAAIGLVNTIIIMVQAVLVMISTGAMVLVARMVGEGHPQATAQVAGQALLAILMLALAVTVGVIALTGPIVDALMIGGEPALKADARLYLRIAMLGLPALMINLVLSGVLRGRGNTKTPMVIALVMNATQLILAFVMVIVLKGGIAAAGWAEVLARLVGATLMFFPFLGKKSLHPLSMKLLKPNWPMMGQLFRVGFPASVERTVVQGGYLMQNALIIGMGTQSATVYQVTSSISNIPYVCNSVLMVVIITLVGQRLGGRRPAQAKLACRQAMIIGGVATMLLSVLVAALGIFLARCYSGEPAVWESTRKMLWILVLANGPALIIDVMSGALKAAGDNRHVMLISFIGVWAVRAPLIWFLCYRLSMGIEGTYWAILADFVTRAGLYYLRYRGSRWLFCMDKSPAMRKIRIRRQG